MAKTKDEKVQEVVEEMQELGYDLTPDRVTDLLEWHKKNPMSENAALAANILIALESKGIKTSP